MEQYISGAGKHANSEGLAQAVTDYWNSLEDSESPALADRGLAPRTARERFRRMGYCWVDLKKEVYKDGHERPDVVAYRQDTVLVVQLWKETVAASLVYGVQGVAPPDQGAVVESGRGLWLGTPTGTRAALVVEG